MTLDDLTIPPSLTEVNSKVNTKKTAKTVSEKSAKKTRTWRKKTFKKKAGLE